jgi:acetyltransferase-like isoleucine patch superfamily enzyme
MTSAKEDGPFLRFAKRRADDLELVTIRLVGLLPIHALRILVLRAWGAKIGNEVTVYHGIEVRCARRLEIGPHTIIGDDAILDARGGLVIGSNVNLSSGVSIWSAQHDWRSPGFDFVARPVSVGDWAWLSARATVLPGVDVGRGAVLAAGALATHAVPERSVYGGVPAKLIGERPAEALGYTLGYVKQKKWWW